MTRGRTDARALDWWVDLSGRQKWTVDRWLRGHSPPEGTTRIQYAYDHRDQIDLPEPVGG